MISSPNFHQLHHFWIHRNPPGPDQLFQDIRWMEIDEVDLLGFEHANIVRGARKTLAKDLLDLPVIANLLTEALIISELQNSTKLSWAGI